MTDYEITVLKTLRCLALSSEPFVEDRFGQFVLGNIASELTELLKNARFIAEFSREAYPSAKITVETLYHRSNNPKKRKKNEKGNHQIAD